MKTAKIEVWFEGDIGPASIEYTRDFEDKMETAFARFFRDACTKFVRQFRVRVSMIEDDNVLF
jgi:hypothetical protein